MDDLLQTQSQQPQNTPVQQQTVPQQPQSAQSAVATSPIVSQIPPAQSTELTPPVPAASVMNTPSAVSQPVAYQASPTPQTPSGGQALPTQQPEQQSPQPHLVEIQDSQLPAQPLFPTPVATSTTSPVQNMQQTPIQEPPVPGAGIHKEFAPMPVASYELQAEEELLTTSEPEMQLPPELKEVGIEEGEDSREQAFFKQMQQASSELGQHEPQQQGMAPDAQAQPAALPMTYQQAAAVKKKGKIWDSITWLATLITYQWKKVNPSEAK